MADGINGILPRDRCTEICILPINTSSICEGGSTNTAASVARARHNPNVFKIIT
jgi:hypothetical protein